MKLNCPQFPEKILGTCYQQVTTYMYKKKMNVKCKQGYLIFLRPPSHNSRHVALLGTCDAKQIFSQE